MLTAGLGEHEIRIIIIVCIVVGVLLILLLACYYCHRRANQSNKGESESSLLLLLCHVGSELGLGGPLVGVGTERGISVEWYSVTSHSWRRDGDADMSRLKGSVDLSLILEERDAF